MVTDGNNESRPLIPATALPKSGKTKVKLWFVYLAFCFPALAGFNFGYDIGAASGAVGSIGKLVTLSTAERSMLISASLIGATAGSIAALWLGEPLGRDTF